MFKGNKDHWGIKRAVKDIFSSNRKKVPEATNHSAILKEDVLFEAFFYQFVPDIWKDSKESVFRHREDIINLAQTSYKLGYIWIKRNNQLKCVTLTENLLREVEGMELPSYLEIEAEKTNWQSKPTYREGQGKTVPLKEEYIQLRMVKK